MKRIVMIVLALALAIGMVACGAPADKETTPPATDESSAPPVTDESSAPPVEESTPPEDTESTAPEGGGGAAKEVKVAFVTDIVDVNSTDHNNHCRYALEQINETQDIVKFTDFTIYNCNMNNDEFIKNMENCVTSGYGLIFTWPVDMVGSVPAYEEAFAAGVNVIDLRGVNETDKIFCWYKGISDDSFAATTKEYVKQMLEADPEKVLEACLVYPQAGHTASYIRNDCIKQLAEEMPGRINLLGEGYGNWNTADAQKLVEDWIQTYPQMNYVLCANDEEALGAINALESAGIKKDVYVMGGNGGMQGTDLILEGRLDATTAQDKAVHAKNLAELAVALYEGKADTLPGFDATTREYNPDIKNSYMLTPDNAAERKADLENYDKVFATY